MTFGERIKNLRESRNLGRRELAEIFEMPYNTLGNYENNEREPGHIFLVKAAKYFGVTTDFLLGNQYEEKEHAEPISKTLSKEAMGIALKYDSLDIYGKKAVSSLLAIELERKNSQKNATNNEIKLIRRVISEQPVAAGSGVYLGPENMRPISVVENPITKRSQFFVPVKGNSMEPKYFDGEILAISDDEVYVGDIGIFTMDGNGYVKKRGIADLISLNSAYEPIPMNDSIICNGKVIGKLEPDWIIE